MGSPAAGAAVGVTAIPGQLAFDFDADTTNGEDDLIARIRERVTEPDMSEAEVEALVVDVLDRLGLAPSGDGPLKPKRCECERPVKLPNPWLAVVTCTPTSTTTGTATPFATRRCCASNSGRDQSPPPSAVASRRDRSKSATTAA